MKGFPGFPPGKVRLIPLPEPFFRQLLPLIDDLGELKLVLFVFWLLSRKKGYPRYVSWRELTAEDTLLRSLALPGRAPEDVLAEALERAVTHGILLHLSVEKDGEREEWYFLNSEKGRQAVESIRRGELEVKEAQPEEISLEKPNIFTLYEQNIGLIQPLIAEELREAERTYPPHWIEEAFKIAVEQNVRKWSYVRSILERWATEGKDDGKSRRDIEEDRRRYIRGKYADYIQH